MNFGVGFGVTFTSTSGDFSSTVPPVEVSYDYAISDKITVGGFVGYSAAEFRSSIFDSEFGFDYTHTCYLEVKEIIIL